MKTGMLFTLLVFTAFVAAGSAQTIDNTGADTGMTEARDYTYGEKYKFIDHMHKALDIVNSELKTLGKESDKLKDEASADTKRKIDDLEVKSAGLSKRLDIVRDTTEAGWNDIKNGISKDYDVLKKTVDQIRTDVYNRAIPGKSTNENM